VQNPIGEKGVELTNELDAKRLRTWGGPQNL
jgi:hypothetical protein